MLTKLETFFAGLSTGALVATGAALWIGTAEGCRHVREAKLEARPVEALPTGRAAAWPTRIEQCPSGPVVYVEVPAKEAERVAEDYQIPAERYRILGEHDLPRMEWGGSALSYLDDIGKEHILVKPKPEPLLEIPSRWSFYVEGAVSVGESNGKRYSGGVQYDALRFARFHIEPFGEAGWREWTGAYAEAGVRLRLQTRR